MSARPTKRRRTHPNFGAPSEADITATQSNTPTALARARRRIPGVQPLSIICAHVVASNFHEFSSESHAWTPNKKWTPVGEVLKTLPDRILLILFSELRSTCPQFLSGDLVVDVRMLRTLKSSGRCDTFPAVLHAWKLSNALERYGGREGEDFHCCEVSPNRRK